MDRTYSIAEARNDLSSVVREAEAGQYVTLSRRGKTVAVVVSAAQAGRGDRERVAHAIRELRGFREACRTGRIDLHAMIETGRR